jgi:murein DD-endopeptidase MepM/ murein hydrolase activator NlpD
MIGKRGIVLLVLFLGSFSIYAQYINVDSMVVVPGERNPLTINEVSTKGISTSADAYKPILNTGQMLADFAFPHQNKIISRFGPRHGRMHNGTDIRMATGDTVIAVYDGKIISSRYYYGFGNLIIIEHQKDVKTYYAHLSKFIKKTGSWVTKGEVIGLAGSTGRATGSHLHFEIRENNRAYDPELVYDFKSNTIREDVETVASLSQLQRRLIPKGYSVNEGVPQYYKVRSGDSLWRISRKFKMSMNHICRLNKISENSVLQLGQPLKLY